MFLARRILFYSMDKNNLNQSVIDEFSLPETLASYRQAVVNIGLWESEKILLEKYFKPGSSVLDIGCGTGRTTVGIFKKGYQVIGLDITPAMIKVAQEISQAEKLAINYEVGDATQLRFSDNEFDNALFSFNGWCQIPTAAARQQALREAYRVIKPGGHFIFTSHIRRLAGGHWGSWARDWVKFKILKPLGYKLGALEFGDIFFTRTNPSASSGYAKKQFIHIVGLAEVEIMIKAAGFNLVFSEYRNTIAPSDSKLESGNCRFFVCQK